jgi:hypothetical protein
MVCRYVQEDLWLSAFPIGTEVCPHPYLQLFYVCGVHLDMAYSLTCAFCCDCNNSYNLAYRPQWENIDKIKEFNWNFENLEVRWSKTILIR